MTTRILGSKRVKTRRTMSQRTKTSSFRLVRQLIPPDERSKYATVCKTKTPQQRAPGTTLAVCSLNLPLTQPEGRPADDAQQARVSRHKLNTPGVGTPNKRRRRLPGRSSSCPSP